MKVTPVLCRHKQKSNTKDDVECDDHDEEHDEDDDEDGGGRGDQEGERASGERQDRQTVSVRRKWLTRPAVLDGRAW